MSSHGAAVRGQAAGHAGRRIALNTLYSRLLSHYGPQGWWPVAPKGSCTPCYTGGPRNEQQRFEVMVGAVLTQNTAWENVRKALASLHTSGLMSAERLLRVRQETLAQKIRSSGYYNQKAVKLKALARFVKQHSLRKLKAMEAEELRQALLEVHGVGKETADSIILYAFDKKFFVVDAYTKRLLSRLWSLVPPKKYDDLQRIFHSSFTGDTAAFNEFHALIVCHAKEVCKSSPQCGECCLSGACLLARTGEA